MPTALLPCALQNRTKPTPCHGRTAHYPRVPSRAFKPKCTHSHSTAATCSSPPIACAILILFIALLALRLDGFITFPYGCAFLPHLALIPYFMSINTYCWKPMIAHQSGWPYGARVTADFLYIIVFPVLYVLKQDGCPWVEELSWVILSTPLHIAVLLAFVATVLERAYECEYAIVVDPEQNPRKERLRRSVIDTGVVLAIMYFVVCFAIYFDGPTRNGNRFSSFSNERLSIFVVFIPAWVCIAVLSVFVPRLVAPPIDTRCGTRVRYALALAADFIAFTCLVVVPCFFFCFKFNNYYQYSHWVPNQWVNQTIGNGTAWTLVRVPQPRTSTIEIAAAVPMIAVVFPGLLALAGLVVFTGITLGHHVRQLWRLLKNHGSLS